MYFLHSRSPSVEIPTRKSYYTFYFKDFGFMRRIMSITRRAFWIVDIDSIRLVILREILLLKQVWMRVFSVNAVSQAPPSVWRWKYSIYSHQFQWTHTLNDLIIQELDNGSSLGVCPDVLLSLIFRTRKQPLSPVGCWGGKPIWRDKFLEMEVCG